MGTSDDQRPPRVDRKAWTPPELCKLPAATAEMPVGKVNPGADGVTMS